MENNRKILSINAMFYFLPEDFNGDVADALELLAKLFRDSDERGGRIGKSLTREQAWDWGLEHFAESQNGGVVGMISLSEYISLINDFVML